MSSPSSGRSSHSRGGEAQVCEGNQALWPQVPTGPAPTRQARSRADGGLGGVARLQGRADRVPPGRREEGQAAALHFPGERGGKTVLLPLPLRFLPAVFTYTGPYVVI